MKLEPVFLVAPSPEPPPPAPTRRSFILALGGGLLAAGAAGFAAGRWTGALAGPSEDAPRVDAPDSAEVAWALGLRDGPLPDLVEQRQTYFVVFASHPASATELVSGFERLADAVLMGELDREVARGVATDLIGWIDTGGEVIGSRLRLVRPDLQRVIR